MNQAYLLIGGNMGDRQNNLERSVKEIDKQAGTVIKQSMFYETAAWGIKDQPSFLNKVILIETDLAANQLLTILLSIEKMLGRKREVKFGPRLIDIDILFFNDDIISADHLSIPHPELHNRRFALVPMHEIASDFTHPKLNKTVSEMLTECSDKLAVNIYAC